MELLIVIGAIVAFFWWRSRSKASLRYQAHKDALDAGRTLLARYSNEVGIMLIPLEYRGHAWRRLENITEHVETTMVPAELGNPGLFQELLEDVTWVQMAVTDNVRFEGRQAMRAMTFSEIFGSLKNAVKAHTDDQPVRHFYDLDEKLPIAAEALTWFGENDTHPDLKITPRKARKLYGRAQKLAEQARLERTERANTAVGPTS